MIKTGEPLENAKKIVHQVSGVTIAWSLRSFQITTRQFQLKR